MRCRYSFSLDSDWRLPLCVAQHKCYLAGAAAAHDPYVSRFLRSNCGCTAIALATATAAFKRQLRLEMQPRDGVVMVVVVLMMMMMMLMVVAMPVAMPWR